MPDAFQLEMVVPAEPQRVFTAWLDSKEHAAFTGGGEAVVEPWAGGRFISWDGYIHGILLGVETGKRIVQTWRTSEFPPEARDSRLTVEFEPARGGTRVRIRHGDLPPSQVKKYEKGWVQHYLKPLADYFAKGGKHGAAGKTAPVRSWGRRPERKVKARSQKKASARKPARKPARRARPAPRKKASASKRRKR